MPPTPDPAVVLANRRAKQIKEAREAWEAKALLTLGCVVAVAVGIWWLVAGGGWAICLALVTDFLRFLFSVKGLLMVVCLLLFSILGSLAQIHTAIVNNGEKQ